MAVPKRLRPSIADNDQEKLMQMGVEVHTVSVLRYLLKKLETLELPCIECLAAYCFLSFLSVIVMRSAQLSHRMLTGIISVVF